MEAFAVNQHSPIEVSRPRCGLQFLSATTFLPCHRVDTAELLESNEYIHFVGDFRPLFRHSRGASQQSQVDVHEYLLTGRLLGEELPQAFPASTFYYTAETFCETILPQLRLQGRKFLLRQERISLFYVLGVDGELFDVYASCDWESVRKKVCIYPFNSFELNPGQHLFSPSMLS